MLLYAIFAVITFTAVQRVGKGAAYRPFVLVHNLQNAVLPLAVLHVPFRWYVLGVLCSISVLHEFMKWRRYKGFDIILHRISRVYLPCTAPHAP